MPHENLFAPSMPFVSVFQRGSIGEHAVVMPKVESHQLIASCKCSMMSVMKEHANIAVPAAVLADGRYQRRVIPLVHDGDIYVVQPFVNAQINHAVASAE